MQPVADAPDRSLTKHAGRLAVVLGAAGLLGYAAGWLYRGAVPLVLGYAHLGACILELSLAWGIFKKKRAAWAYGVALEGTIVLVNLLGLAQILQAGTVGTASAVLIFVRAVLLGLLIVDHKEFK
jgi:hypothetical protein